MRSRSLTFTCRIECWEHGIVYSPLKTPNLSGAQVISPMRIQAPLSLLVFCINGRHYWPVEISRLPIHRRITSFPICLPCQIYSIASSAFSKEEIESMISSNRICVAEIAAQRSSMSCFDPALMPLASELAELKLKHMTLPYLKFTLLSMISGRSSAS